MQATYPCRCWGPGSRARTAWGAAGRTGPRAGTWSGAGAGPRVAGRRPGSRGAPAVARWALAPQAVAAGWVACRGEQDPGAPHRACAAVAATLAAASADLVASPIRWSQVAGPCGRESTAGLLELPGAAGALLEGACAGGWAVAAPCAGEPPQSGAGAPAGWLAAEAEAPPGGAAAAGAGEAPGGAPAGAGAHPAASGEEAGSRACTGAVAVPVR